MSTVPPIQDMPPQGGYSKINYARIPAKKVFTGVKVIAAFIVMQASAIYVNRVHKMPKLKYKQLEMRSAWIAVNPFLQAEEERAKLLRLRENRDIEGELMKDVEGWEVGTLYGKAVYDTAEKDSWHQLYPYEYYVHADKYDMNQNFNCIYRR